MNDCQETFNKLKRRKRKKKGKEKGRDKERENKMNDWDVGKGEKYGILKGMKAKLRLFQRKKKRREILNDQIEMNWKKWKYWMAY